MQKVPFHYVTTPEPHVGRMRNILKTHPEVQKLIGKEPWTVFWVLAVVSAQIALAIWAAGHSFWLLLGVSYVAGATLNHALWVLIHDCTHDLAVKKKAWNRLLAIIANIPIAIPGAAINFRKYHLIHHRFQGELDKDADLPSPIEVKLVGTNPVMKTLWLMFYSFIQGVVRPARVKQTEVFERWALTNVVIVSAALAAVYSVAGFMPIVYFLLSTFFGLGLHPFGARWIQEHFVFDEDQETYSYYGPLNRLMFNVGYHNEHHDLMGVPWSKLPELKKMAPEYYDTLKYHSSYVALIWRFISDKNIGPQSRAVRPSKAPLPKKAPTPGAGQPAVLQPNM